MLTRLTGQIEKITYLNEQNGFTVLQVSLPGRPEPVTVVGCLLSPTPGEMLEMRGEWIAHAKFGQQFRLVEHRTIVPATEDGIRKYLGSGLIAGLGPKLADRIVKKFGARTLAVIENDIDQLASVAGIGSKRLALIRKAWFDQREIRDVMLFLQSHNVSTGHAIKIFRQYGNRSITLVRTNPYRLANDIFGIGFATADQIAARLGFTPEAPERVAAGLLYTLHKLGEEGHVYCPYEHLVARGQEVLKVGRGVLTAALDRLAVDRKVVIEDLHDETQAAPSERKAVYLEKFYFYETNIAQRLRALMTHPRRQLGIQLEAVLTWVQQHLPVKLARLQLSAVKTTLTNEVTVITGGPGTGKTTLIGALVKIYVRLSAELNLAAPTGRAAKRLSVATGHNATTIHRLLEYSFKKGGFQRNAARPLTCDLLIVDEASMIDTRLMHHLLQALPRAAVLILVGDVDQLPSVGAGNILSDLIASGTIPTVRLTEIFRQARTSRIIVNAHNINHGRMPVLASADSETHADFFFIEQEDPEKVLTIILKLVGQRIPRRFGLDPLNDIQVLTPMHKGLIGADNLNRQLQQTLNPGASDIERGGQAFRVGDKVMQIRNNYDKEVFNGDMGTIAHIRALDQSLTVAFDGHTTPYTFAELDDLVLAYAISIHKSQGSEYPAVVIPVLTQHYVLLQRNLIYTAVTRGRQLVVMVGTRKALAMGINNSKTRERHTFLAQRLRLH